MRKLVRKPRKITLKARKQKSGTRSAESSQLDNLTKELQEKERQLIQTLADFDNYRRRIVRESQDIGKAGKRDLVMGVLSVMDSFERAFQSEVLRRDIPVYEGLLAISRQLERLLEQHQVKSFAALGQPFNPSYHEAVGIEPTHQYEEGVVAKEIQRGYLWDDKVLRPAQVLVAKNSLESVSLDQMV